MALGSEVKSMKKQSEQWKQSPDNWKPGMIVVVLIIVGLIGAIAFVLSKQDLSQKETYAPAATEEPASPEVAPKVEVDENGIPTTESLEKLEESEMMEEYYQEQLEEAQKQEMQEPESNNLEDQPY